MRADLKHTGLLRALCLGLVLASTTVAANSSDEAASPERKALAALADYNLPSATRYFAGRKAIAEGVSTSDAKSQFNQYYATQAQFVGEYDEASRLYGSSVMSLDPVGAGYDRAVDGLPVVLASAKGRQAVFLNESHGQSQTRAANYSLLSGLRAEGFDVLGIETLTTVPAAKGKCDAALHDPGLPARGYPIPTSGYYLADPVFAETVREALRLGFRLVPYEWYEGDDKDREQGQAEQLACVFKADPKARLVVIAGFGHVSEKEELGRMAWRFRKASGIDPLTVNATAMMALDPMRLRMQPWADARRAPYYALQNESGDNFGSDGFDMLVYVPVQAPTHRHDSEPSWLELGGARRRVAVAREECKDKDPCLVEARRVGEIADAVPGDRCVLGLNDKGCTLFLPPGRFEIATFDSANVEIGRRVQEVPGG